MHLYAWRGGGAWPIPGGVTWTPPPAKYPLRMKVTIQASDRRLYSSNRRSSTVRTGLFTLFGAFHGSDQADSRLIRLAMDRLYAVGLHTECIKKNGVGCRFSVISGWRMVGPEVVTDGNCVIQELPRQSDYVIVSFDRNA